MTIRRSLIRSSKAGVAALCACWLLLGSLFPAGASAAGIPKTSALALRLVRPAPSDVPRSIFPSRDLGRRSALAPVTATILLRYNHQAELDALVANQADRRSPLYRHFLTSAQFNAYFAPTPQQHAYVIAALRRAGLTVTHVFPNRTLLDVRAPSAAAERFFGTEIHSIAQTGYGTRFANVKPIVVPAGLAPLVARVSLSNLVTARSAPRLSPVASLPVAGAPAVRHVVLPGRFRISGPAAPAIGVITNNVVLDYGFESGAFGHGWRNCQSKTPKPSPLARFTTALVHTGKHAGLAGSLGASSGEQAGFAGLCQLVKIPAGAYLSAYLYQLTNERSTKYAGQDVLLLDGSGATVATLNDTATNYKGWAYKSWDLAAYANRSLYIYFGVHGDGAKGYYTQQYVDDVELLAPPKTPSPAPTVPASPSPKPTATPVGTPTATPTPTSSPTSSACTASADDGPVANAEGTLATGVAEAFDFPVQHGCSGAGETVAVEIDSPIAQSDIDEYLDAAGVVASGVITNVPVDGGGTYSTAAGSATSEASLDVETVAGLAPGANIRVYNFPDLTDQSVEDGYDEAVSDNLASVVNSSFGGCETSDLNGSSEQNTIAEQGAALGITFVASSGDDGSDECSTTNDPPGVTTPASGPYFVAVGAVQFTESNAGALTYIAAPNGTFLSGGGVSTFWPLPSYQQGVTNVITSGRNVPDLALPGVDAVVYQADTAFAIDGTSWSSPQFAALLATASELKATRFGYVDPTIYSVFAATAYADFTDVTIGNNGYYQAKTGYDQVTGIGAPKGYAFAKSL